MSKLYVSSGCPNPHLQGDSIVKAMPRARASVARTPNDYPAGSRPTYRGMRTLGADGRVTVLDAYRFGLDLARQDGIVPDERLADPSFGGAAMVKFGTSIRSGGGARPLPSDKGITRSDERKGDWKVDPDLTAAAGRLLLDQRATTIATIQRDRAAQRRLGSQYTGADTWPGATPRAKKAAAKKAAPRTRFTTCCFQVIALTAECGCATDVTSAPVHAHA